MSVQAPPRKYRIERYLAEGGMGAIYVGKKLGAGGFEKEVVLKQLLPEFTQRPEFRDLFFREAKISGTLDHVNIVRTFDLVRSEDALFIVMEHVHGTDLRTISWRARRRRRSLSLAGVVHVAMEILAGLAYAHSRRSAKGDPLGIIHRDVSPSNILCSSQGEVKLSDFGIAKAVTYSSVFYRVRGKVGYMSPEQARNQPIDARSDLFSLAVCIFETLTGERLYPGELQTPPDVIYGQPIPSLLAKCPVAPPALETVLRKALAQDPDRRFQDAAAFAQALRDVARRHGLLYSGPELAAELTRLLGPDPDTWLRDEPAVSVVTERLPAPRQLEGMEAASLGIDSPEIPSAPPDRVVGAAPAPVADDGSTSPMDVPWPPPSPAPYEPPAESIAVAGARRRRGMRRLVLVSAAVLIAVGLLVARAFGGIPWS